MSFLGMTAHTRPFLMSAAVVWAAASSPAPVKGATADLVGSWRLVSQEEQRADGTVVALWGPDPRGRLTYDGHGRMAVQLMDPRRKRFAAQDRLAGTPEEVKDAFGGYVAYFGSYSVDPDAGMVIHHVEGALFPNWIGTDLRRAFSHTGNRLRLSTPPMLVGGRTSTYVLVWEREE